MVRKDIFWNNVLWKFITYVSNLYYVFQKLFSEWETNENLWWQKVISVSVCWLLCKKCEILQLDWFYELYIWKHNCRAKVVTFKYCSYHCCHLSQPIRFYDISPCLECLCCILYFCMFAESWQVIIKNMFSL